MPAAQNDKVEVDCHAKPNGLSRNDDLTTHPHSTDCECSETKTPSARQRALKGKPSAKECRIRITDNGLRKFTLKREFGFYFVLRVC
ncbi:hypothetical protein [Campylobacter troglodytis]|uniref:hypothetical protein n=1 Tax=Campylobacter troglodytis TaxID=654363 RepID=UPI00115A0659|nr:hypothetical protein [Campylobacter troglodytis]